MTATGEHVPPCSKCGIHLEPDDGPCWLHDCPLRVEASGGDDRPPTKEIA